MKQVSLILSMLLLLVAAGCKPVSSAAGKPQASLSPTPPMEMAQTAVPNPPETTPAQTPVSSTALETVPPDDTPAPSPTPRPTLAPEAWKELPVVPAVSERTREIFRIGVELGNNPNAFSKVGDCGSTPAWFLGDFDRGPRYYSLGEFQYLEGVIQEFQGSYARTSLAAKSGFNASSVFTTLWANRDYCLANEAPLACEYRLHEPGFAFITLGTNDIWHMDTFEPQMRRIIEFSIENGVVPILSTKADNEEGDGSINATIARLADEYEIPLWNYWAAVQPLPDQGLQEDGAHITWGPNRFDDPQAMQKGWTIRNLTALQVLDSVWRGVND